MMVSSRSLHMLAINHTNSKSFKSETTVKSALCKSEEPDFVTFRENTSDSFEEDFDNSTNDLDKGDKTITEAKSNIKQSILPVDSIDDHKKEDALKVCESCKQRCPIDSPVIEGDEDRMCQSKKETEWQKKRQRWRQIRDSIRGDGKRSLREKLSEEAAFARNNSVREEPEDFAPLPEILNLTLNPVIFQADRHVSDLEKVNQ